MMRAYQDGLDILGAEAPRCLTWWEAGAILVGALASLATLTEVTLRWKNGGRR